jgi:hypothetical protein
MSHLRPAPAARAVTRTQAGFTLIEALVAVTFLVPVLLGAVQLTQVVGRSVDTSVTSTQSQAQLQRTLRVVSEFTQTMKMASLRMRAVAADVTAGIASNVGDWIDPTDLVWRPAVQFVSAAGELSMNARLSTSARQVVFTMEPTETANAIDDDGDGFVDEGQIRLLHEGNEIAIVHNVESCSFNLEGRVLRARIGVARRAGDGRIDRAVLERAIFLRNN